MLKSVLSWFECVWRISIKALSTALNLPRSTSLVVPHFGVVAAVLHVLFTESDMRANHYLYARPPVTDQVSFDGQKRTASENICRSGRTQLE